MQSTAKIIISKKKYNAYYFWLRWICRDDFLSPHHYHSHYNIG